MTVLQAKDRQSGTIVALKLYRMHKLNNISSHQVAREVRWLPPTAFVCTLHIIVVALSVTCCAPGGALSSPQLPDLMAAACADLLHWLCRCDCT